MSRRAVEISQTYTPGKNLGGTRTVTIDRIPATEVTYDGMTDIRLTCEVAERTDTLIDRALASNDLPQQRIVYTVSDPGVPVVTGPRAERVSHRDGRQSPAPGGDVR